MISLLQGPLKPTISLPACWAVTRRLHKDLHQHATRWVTKMPTIALINQGALSDLLCLIYSCTKVCTFISKKPCKSGTYSVFHAPRKFLFGWTPCSNPLLSSHQYCLLSPCFHVIDTSPATVTGLCQFWNSGPLTSGHTVCTYRILSHVETILAPDFLNFL